MTRPQPPGRLLAVFLAFAGLGVIYSWPLALHFFDAIPYAYDQNPVYKTAKLFQGDHLQLYYHLGLLKQAALGKINWFTNPLEFATPYQGKGFFSYFLPLSIIYLPFAFISGPFAYNLFLLLSFGASGLAMYLWGRELTGSRAAGFAAAFVFDFIPIRLVELYGGHPAGFAIFLVPLALFFFDRAVKRSSAAYGAAAGFTVWMLSFQYLYFCYYLLMFLMVYIPWRLVPAFAYGMKERGAGTAVKRLVLSQIVFAVGLMAAVGWMYYYKKSAVEGAAMKGGRTIGEISLFSPPLSAMWDPNLNWSVYIGLPAVAALFGLVAGVLALRKKAPNRLDMLFFTAVFAGSYILAFGPTLDKHIPLYSLFYNYFPYFSLSRAPAKIMVVSITALSALVAFMTRWILAERRGKAFLTGAGAALLVLTAVDYHPRRDIGICLLDEGNRIYHEIEGTAGAGKVLNLPVWPGESSWESIYQYYAIQSGVPMINGYSPVVSQNHVDKVFWPLFPLNSGDISTAQVQLLKEFGVNSIVFHEEAYPPKVSAFPASFALKRLIASPYLELADKEEPLWLFKIADPPRKMKTSEITSPIGFLFQAESLVKIKGKAVEDKDALNGWALYGGPDSVGILNAGPYRTFPGGTYKATFRIKVSDNTSSEPVLKLDVTGQEGRVIVREKLIKGAEFEAPDKYQDFTVEYTLAPGAPWQVEFRAHLLGGVSAYVDTIYVRFADMTDPAWEYEAEDMYYTGRITPDPDASGGKAVVSEPGRDPADLMVYGPGRMYDAGSYEASFRVKANAASKDAAIVELEAVSGNTWESLSKREVKMDELPGTGVYGEVTLPYTLNTEDTVELRVRFGGVTETTVDRIRIKKTEALGHLHGDHPCLVVDLHGRLAKLFDRIQHLDMFWMSGVFLHVSHGVEQRVQR